MAKLTIYTFGKERKRLRALIDKAIRQKKRVMPLRQELNELQWHWVLEYYGGFAQFVTARLRKQYKRLARNVTDKNPILERLKRAGKCKV